MTATAALSAVLVVGMITYASRAGLILFLAERPLPSPLVRALRYVGPAVLSALTINLVAGGEGASGVEFAEVAAVSVGALVAFLRKNLIASLTAGMLTLWLLLILF